MDRQAATGSGRRWFAVRSHPRREGFAYEQLRRQGFRAFLPLISTVGSVPTNPKTQRTAFFPSYLFVNLDLVSDRWHCVNNTFGVQKIVAFGGCPAPAPYGLIENLLALSTDTGEVRFSRSFSAGDRVRIIGGPLHGKVGEFEAMRPHERVHVLLQILNRETRVDVAHTSLIPA